MLLKKADKAVYTINNALRDKFLICIIKIVIVLFKKNKKYAFPINYFMITRVVKRGIYDQKDINC